MFTFKIVTMIKVEITWRYVCCRQSLIFSKWSFTMSSVTSFQLSWTFFSVPFPFLQMPFSFCIYPTISLYPPTLASLSSFLTLICLTKLLEIVSGPKSGGT